MKMKDYRTNISVGINHIFISGHLPNIAHLSIFKDRAALRNVKDVDRVRDF